MTTTTSKLKKLGTGPFAVCDLIAPDDAVRGLGEIANPDFARCACCGSKRLSWRVLIRDEPTGKQWLVGRSCAAKAGDLDLAKIEELAARAERKRLQNWRSGMDEDAVAFRAFCAAQPHPKGWAKRTLLDDLNYWAGRQQGRAYSRWARVYAAYAKGTEAGALQLSKDEERRAAARFERTVAKVRRAWEDVEQSHVPNALHETFESERECFGDCFGDHSDRVVFIRATSRALIVRIEWRDRLVREFGAPAVEAALPTTDLALVREEVESATRQLLQEAWRALRAAEAEGVA